MTADEDAREYWTRAAVVILYGGVHVACGLEALNCLIRGEPWDWTEMLLAGAVWAGVMTALAALQWVGWIPFHGDREGRALLRDALASDELPPEAQPDAWATLLEAEIRELTHSRWGVLVLMLTVTGLVAAAAVVNEDQRVWALAIAIGGFVGAPFRLLKVRRQRAEALLDRVLAGRSN